MAVLVKVVTPPALEPVDAADLRSYLLLDTTDADLLLTSLIREAREWAEGRTRRALLTQTLRATLPIPAPTIGRLSGWVTNFNWENTPAARLELPRPPLQAVSLVEVETAPNVWSDVNAGLLSPDSNWVADPDQEPGTIWLYGGAWSSFGGWGLGPSGLRMSPRLRVTYTAGYGANPTAVPETIRNAIRMYAAKKFEGRDSQTRMDTWLDGLDAFRIMQL